MSLKTHTGSFLLWKLSIKEGKTKKKVVSETMDDKNLIFLLQTCPMASKLLEGYENYYKGHQERTTLKQNIPYYKSDTIV